MDKVLDFDKKLFGNLTEYKQLIVNLLESLKVITPVTFWDMQSSTNKGLTSIIMTEIIDIVLDSYDKIADNLYSNDLVSHEFPYFIEVKEMVECLLSDHVYDNDDFINLAIALSSDYFTLLEVKLLLYEGYTSIIEVPDHIVDEYSKELDQYIERFDKYRDDFIKLYE